MCCLKISGAVCRNVSSTAAVGGVRTAVGTEARHHVLPISSTLPGSSIFIGHPLACIRGRHMIIAVMMLMMELDCRDERHRRTVGALNHEDRPRDEITGPRRRTHRWMDGWYQTSTPLWGMCVRVCVLVCMCVCQLCVCVCVCVFVFVCLYVRKKTVYRVLVWVCSGPGHSPHRQPIKMQHLCQSAGRTDAGTGARDVWQLLEPTREMA